MTVSDVDWRLRENDDGSATVFVGAIEQVSRMRWTVGISLLPGRDQVYTDIRIKNRTGLPHRYYFWSNSGERVTMGTRFISPVTSPTRGRRTTTSAMRRERRGTIQMRFARSGPRG